MPRRSPQNPRANGSARASATCSASKRESRDFSGSRRRPYRWARSRCAAAARRARRSSRRRRGRTMKKCVSAGSCRQSEAVRRLAQLPKARPPILILAAHGVEGGAQLLHRVVVEACRLLLTPRRGAACAFVEGFDGCDAESSDVCMLNDGRFSAARYVERGYRLVHLRRDPADVLARSYQLHEPNATHAKNLTLLQEGLEDEWRSLLAGTVYSMQAMADAHRADPRALYSASRISRRPTPPTPPSTASSALRSRRGAPAPPSRRRGCARRWRSRLAPRSRRRRMAGACASTCSGWCSASPPSATTSRSCSAPSATRRSSAPRRWARWAFRTRSRGARRAGRGRASCGRRRNR